MTERNFVFAISASTFAILVTVITIPLLHEDLQHLKSEIFEEIDDFRTSTDTIWADLLEIEKSSGPVKRDVPFVYSYLPFTHRKTKPSLRHLFEQSSTEKPSRGDFSDVEATGIFTERNNKIKTHSLHGKCELRANPECPPGPPGPPGQDGEDGEDGLHGLVGIDGLGSQGDISRNMKCMQCPLGPPGPPGPRGPTGPRGKDGQDGKPGAISVGPPGPKGEPGPQGIIGTPGTPGEPGKFVIRWVSPPGEKGLPGSIGKAGKAGPRGRDGKMGRTGVRGKTGRTGRTGGQGAQGNRGKAGKRGRTPRGSHYCKCPKRSKNVRGHFTVGVKKNGSEVKHYPKDLNIDLLL